MSIESADRFEELDPSLPQDTDPAAEGAAHLRMVKGVPSGVIVMWSGASVPDGWTLCNGQSGTADSSGNHSHTVDTTPPYYVLASIMKV